MPRLTIVLCGMLLTTTVYALDDADPEPPRPNKVHAVLVAKKATYKLDLGGRTPQQYADAVKDGKMTPIAVDLELVTTNYRKSDIRVRLTGSSPKLNLTLKGKGVVEGVMPTDKTKSAITYATLKPGQKVAIPITALASVEWNKAVKKAKGRHWTEPGEYTVEVSFYTRIDLDYNGGNGKAPFNYETLKPPPVKVKVEK